MRTKQEIVHQLEERKISEDGEAWKQVPVEIELLLDIRELLLNAPKEH